MLEIIRHSALLISDLGIYFSNPRGTYIKQVSRRKRRVEIGTLSAAPDFRYPVRMLL